MTRRRGSRTLAPLRLGGPLAPRIAGLALAALALVAAALAPAAHAAPAWLAPVDVSVAGQAAAAPQLAGNEVVWVAGDVVRYSQLEGAGAFSAPIALSAAGQPVAAPQLSKAAAGTLAVWERSTGTNTVVQSSLVRFGAPDAPIDLSAPGRDAHHPQVAGTVSDGSVAVWERSNATNTVIQAAVAPREQSFGAPVDVSLAGQDALDPHVASRSAEMIAVWRRFDGSDWRVQAAVGPNGGSFGTPVDLSAAGEDALSPQIAMGSGGDAVVVWRRFDGTHWVVQAAVRPVNGDFSAPVDLSAADRDAFDPAVAGGYQANAIVVWRAEKGADHMVQAAQRLTAGPFAAPVDLSAVAPSAISAPQVTNYDSNLVIAVWSRATGAGHVVQAASRAYGEDFKAPVDVSAPGEDAVAPQAGAFGSFGDGIVVWQRAGTGEAVRAAGYDRIYPDLSIDVFSGRLLGPGSGTVNRPVTFTAPPAFDNWSAIGTPTWKLGDGALAAGSTVTHTYARPGTYQVELRVPDAVDNARILTQPIQISAAAPPPPAPPAAPAPVLSGLRLAPASFRAARTGSSTTSAAPRRGIGMRVVYALDVAARVRFTVQRAVAGRRAGARCVAPGKANRAGKRCTRFARVSGSFARTRPAGRDRFTFTGRLAARRLAPGRYRLVATPSASGRTGKLAHVSMRIVR